MCDPFMEKAFRWIVVAAELCVTLACVTSCRQSKVVRVNFMQREMCSFALSLEAVTVLNGTPQKQKCISAHISKGFVAP